MGRAREGGWTLIELVITITVMSVLALGAIPLVKTAVGFDHAGVHLMSSDGRSLPAQGSQIRLAVK